MKIGQIQISILAAERRQTASTGRSRIKIALRGVSERLNSMSMERLSGVRGGIPPLLAPPPFKAGGKAKQRKAEFKLPIYRELVLPYRGGSRIYANF
jgi:hypothetical protein